MHSHTVHLIDEFRQWAEVGRKVDCRVDKDYLRFLKPTVNVACTTWLAQNTTTTRMPATRLCACRVERQLHAAASSAASKPDGADGFFHCPRRAYCSPNIRVFLVPVARALLATNLVPDSTRPPRCQSSLRGKWHSVSQPTCQTTNG